MKIDRKKYFLYLIIFIIAVLIVKYWEKVINGVFLFMDVISPLILGAMIAYVLNILLKFYEEKILSKIKNKRIKSAQRILSILMSLATIIIFIILVAWIIIPELKSCIEVLIKSLPETAKSMEKFWIKKFGEIDGLKFEKIDWNDISNKIISWVQSGFGSTMGTIMGYVTSVFTAVINFIMGFIFSIYILAQKEKLKDQIVRCMKIYGKESMCEKIFYILRVVDNCFHSFIVGQCAEAVILGILCVLGMLIFQFPYAVMIGVLIGCTALIPIAGAYIGGTVGVIMIFTESPFKAIMFIVFIIVLQQLEGQFIYPKVVGSSIGLPGIWVFAAVIVGGGLFGISGILIGIPLISAIYTLLKNDIQKREEVLEKK